MESKRPCIASKAIIKPSSPTPIHLRSFSLSLIDQLAPHFYLPVVLFYSKLGTDSPSNIGDDDKSSFFKKSLSETLTRYYPFAGRLSSKDIIDCNDEGLDFYEARVDCTLADVLKQPEPSTMDLFSPPGMLFNESFKGSPFIVQITYFSCGGIAVSGSMLHKVGDAATSLAFFGDWAAVACGKEVYPKFISFLISPLNGQIALPETKHMKDACVTKRFSFDASKLAELKAIVSDSGIHNPTRVEVVTALIYKCAMAASNAKSGTIRPSVLMQTVNLRPRVVPPLPQNSVGNFSWFFRIMPKDESDKKLESITAALKKAAAEFSEKYAKNLTADGCYSLICDSIKESQRMLRPNSSDIDVYRCSSLCRYPFNQMNFGWGNPIWVGTCATTMKNTFHLLDSVKAGGIEAIVSLEKEVMAIFENDGELLRFAATNPSAADY